MRRPVWHPCRAGHAMRAAAKAAAKAPHASDVAALASPWLLVLRKACSVCVQ